MITRWSVADCESQIGGDLNAIGNLPSAIRSLTVLCLLATAAGCGSMDKARQNLAPVALPDLSRSDENVQVQARQLYATLNRALDRPLERSAAYVSQSALDPVPGVPTTDGQVVSPLAKTS